MHLCHFFFSKCTHQILRFVVFAHLVNRLSLVFFFLRFYVLVCWAISVLEELGFWFLDSWVLEENLIANENC